MAAALIHINGGGKVGAKYRHDKQTQQVTTMGCGSANGGTYHGNDLREPTSMTMGRWGGDDDECDVHRWVLFSK